MAIQTATQKNTLASSYGTAATHGALFTSTGPTTAGAATNEVTATGSPAYARKSLTWGAPTNGVITASATFDVPSGTTVTYAGVCSSVTQGAATVLDFAAVTSQTFASQGTYALSLTYTQT